jgi:hypothetical protein
LGECSEKVGTIARKEKGAWKWPRPTYISDTNLGKQSELIGTHRKGLRISPGLYSVSRNRRARTSLRRPTSSSQKLSRCNTGAYSVKITSLYVLSHELNNTIARDGSGSKAVVNDGVKVGPDFCFACDLTQCLSRSVTFTVVHFRSWHAHFLWQSLTLL